MERVYRYIPIDTNTGLTSSIGYTVDFLLSQDIALSGVLTQANSEITSDNFTSVQPISNSYTPPNINSDISTGATSVVTGYTSSKLDEIKAFGGGYTVSRDGSNGIISNTVDSSIAGLNYPVNYIIDGIVYTTFADGYTTYVITNGNLNFITEYVPLISQSIYEGFADTFRINSDVLIERGDKSVNDLYYKLNLVDKIENLFRYRITEIFQENN